MPKQVDYVARRHELAEALWRLTRREGWEAISLRKVAAEAGVSMGMVQHAFTSTDQMLAFAIQMISEDVRDRIRTRVALLPQPHDPREVIAAALLEMIPDPGRRASEAEAAAVFIRRFLLKPDTAEEVATANPSLRDFLIDQLGTARPHDQDEEIEQEADTLLALLDGLIYSIVSAQQTPRSATKIMHTQIARACQPTKA